MSQTMTKNNEKKKPEFVTMREAALRLGVNKSTVWRAVKRLGIETRTDVVDSRLQLVDYDKLADLFKRSIRHGNVN